MRLAVQPQDQGATNGCGTTCLSMVLEYWRPGLPNHDRARIDQTVRPYDMFTAPGDLERYARKQGLQATRLVDSQWEDLQSLLTEGLPAMLLVDPSAPHGASLHWILAVGYEPGEDESSTQYTVIDPAGGRTVVMTGEELERIWSDLHLRGLPTLVSRVAVLVSPAHGPKLDDLLPVRPLQTAGGVLLAAQGVKDVAAGYHHHRPALAVVGGLELALAMPGALGSLIAGWGDELAKGRSRILRLVSPVFGVPGWLMQLVGILPAWLGATMLDAIARRLLPATAHMAPILQFPERDPSS